MTPSSRSEVLSSEVTLAILGGGVAGLSLALALTRSGVECRVFEQSADVWSGGMGFILMPDGMRALEQLGMAESVRRAGHRAEYAEVRSSAGVCLSAKRLPEHVCILRRVLLKMLSEELPAGVLRPGVTFAGFGEEAGGRHVAYFEEDAACRAAAFVGADGKRSRVRELLFPAYRPEVAPVTELINILHAPDVTAALRGRLLKFRDTRGGLAVGVAAVGQGWVVWYLQFDVRVYPAPPDRAGEKERFARRILRGWSDPLSDLIRRTDFAGSYLSTVVRMRTLPRLNHRNAVLVGDAAHPLPTLLGQGANAAVCDALLLADALQGCCEPNGLQQGFARFSRRRLPSVEALHRAGQAKIDAFTRSFPYSRGVCHEA